jgi:hypothetical protein
MQDIRFTCTVAVDDDDGLTCVETAVDLAALGLEIDQTL